MGKKVKKAIEELRKDMLAGGLLEDDNNPKTWEHCMSFIKSYDMDAWVSLKNVKSLHIDPVGEGGFQIRMEFFDEQFAYVTKPTKIFAAAQYELRCLMELIWDFGMENCVWRVENE